MAGIAVLTTPVLEKSSALYTCTLRDENGTPIVGTAVQTAVVTLTDQFGTVVNSRTAQDVKNTNGGSIGASNGLFSLLMVGADHALTAPELADDTRNHERRLTLVVTFSRVGGTTGTLTHEARWPLYELDQVS